MKNLMERAINMKKHYDDGVITSKINIIKTFSLFIRSGLIDTLPQSYKKVANELIYEGFINEDGSID